MRKYFPVEDLARDSRFQQVNMAERMADPRSAFAAGEAPKQRSNRLVPSRADASSAARALMHGIFVGEIQALEGAGRTCHDFRTQGDQAHRAQDAAAGTSGEASDAADAVPFALKLDMARQAWDEARHVEISVKLSDWMGGEIGEYAENTVLFQAACSTDPILRLAGVNRALEGLAIDVFTTMRDFAVEMNDDVLYYAEDWMLADEVTHVKMGSDWLRKVTANDPQRQKDALEFQKAVDKLFSFGGFRGERDDNPVHLARNFRKLAGFSEAEIDELVDISAAAYEETVALIAQATAAMATAS